MANTQAVAQAMLREIPVSQISSVVGKFNPGPVAEACGSGCGGGCGGGCRSAVGVSFDQFGQSGITMQDVAAAHADPVALKSALQQQALEMLK